MPKKQKCPPPEPKGYAAGGEKRKPGANFAPPREKRKGPPPRISDGWKTASWTRPDRYRAYQHGDSVVVVRPVTTTINDCLWEVLVDRVKVAEFQEDSIEWACHHVETKTEILR